jgi:Flp pilus assembly protein TadD
VTALATALVEAQAAPSDVALAEPVLAAALVKFPKDAELLYAIGTLRAVQHKYEEADRLYREVLKLDPMHVAALNNLAMVLAESPRDRGEALTLIDQAIALLGQQPTLLDTKGAILVFQGRSSEAISLLETAAQEQAVDVRHRFHLAAAYRDVGDVEKARGQLRTALDQQLERQFLTHTDQKLLAELKSTLIP